MLLAANLDNSSRRNTSVCVGLILYSVFYFTAYLVFYGVWINNSYSFVSVPLLLLSVGLFLSACALVGVITTYISLIHENYHWWWMSFLAPAGTGLWVFIACLVTGLSLLKSLDEMIIFLVINLALATLIGITGGALGFFASYYFVIHLYTQLRVQ